MDMTIDKGMPDRECWAYIVALQMPITFRCIGGSHFDRQGFEIRGPLRRLWCGDVGPTVRALLDGGWTESGATVACGVLPTPPSAPMLSTGKTKGRDVGM